jgi:hypothetical protein
MQQTFVFLSFRHFAHRTFERNAACTSLQMHTSEYRPKKCAQLGERACTLTIIFIASPFMHSLAKVIHTHWPRSPLWLTSVRLICSRVCIFVVLDLFTLSMPPFPVCYRSGLRAHHRTCVAETLHTTSSPPPFTGFPSPHTHTNKVLVVLHLCVCVLHLCAPTVISCIACLYCTGTGIHRAVLLYSG